MTDYSIGGSEGTFELEMTAEQILKEIEALSQSERERLVQRMRQLAPGEIPQDFMERSRIFRRDFCFNETALNEAPPDA